MDAALIVLDGSGLDKESVGRNAVADASTPAMNLIRRQGSYDAIGVLAGRWPSEWSDGQQRGRSPHDRCCPGRKAGVHPDRGRHRRRLAPRERCDPERVCPRQGNRRPSSLDGAGQGGVVHFDRAHLNALTELAAVLEAPAVTHAFTDGRDTDPTAGAAYLDDLSAVVDEYGTADVATVAGRYYAMDRDEHWDQTRHDRHLHHRGADHHGSTLAADEPSYR